MKIKILLSVFILFVIGLIAYYDMSSAPAIHMQERVGSIQGYSSGKQAPDFTFTDLNGKESRLSALRGKVVLINFWASWCTPCLTEFPKMIRLIEHFNGDVVLLAISKDENIDDIHRFLARFPELPKSVIIVLDQDKHISHDIFHTVRLPETIIIGTDQTMRRKIIGEPNIWEGAEIYQYLQNLITP